MIEAVFGLVGVIVGSVITIFKEVWMSWRERRRDASYSAIRLICLLEEYAHECIPVVYDDGTAYGKPAGRTEQGEEYYKPQVSLPNPPDFPDDIAWRSLPQPLMHKTLALPNKARSTNGYIAACDEHDGPPFFSDVFEARQNGYALLALDALDIADEYRKHFKISVESRAGLNADWNPKGVLREKIAEFEKHQTDKPASPLV
jgi:hypothetical protein